MFKKGQLSVFVIIAILIVAGVGLYFLLRTGTTIGGIPSDLRPVYESYSSCLQEDLKGAINLAETQGGWIFVPEFRKGNEQYPSGSQLNFNGFPVPYWSYISESGYRREQSISKSEIEKQISQYLESEIRNCNFDYYRERGYIVDRGEVSVSTTINNENVKITVNEDLSTSYNNNTAIKSSHEVQVSSKLGKFFGIANNIYLKQKSDNFLEKYGIDTLRSYAPVDGVEITCAPKLWNPDDVVAQLLDATEANTAFLRLKNNNFGLSNPNNKYFIIDSQADENVRFMYAKSFPTKIEIWPAENNIMMAEPVGLQEGLGILGFCYVPYHFVYDFYYPIMIQVYDDNEMFQFPVVVGINKNQINNATLSGQAEDVPVDLCQYKNSNVRVYTYDTKLNPVEANISFKCFSSECDIGATKTVGKDAILNGNFPACVNGFVFAETKGYKTSSVMVSTNEGNEADIMLQKDYDLQLNVPGLISGDMAVINFESEQDSFSVVYPQQKSLTLSEAEYNITAFIYRNSTINFPASKTTKCIDVPKSGLLGYIGGTEQTCFEMDIPSQTISQTLSGGGKATKYFIESELNSGKILDITIPNMKAPTTLTELQNNYILLDNNILNIEVK